jgi:hypothetical protein|tara:strand:- start:5144 stop:5584 length:441 start_codon:yes stop_codon:yes gene_type:complete
MIIALTIISTILCIFSILIFLAVASLHAQLTPITSELSQIRAMVKQQMTHYTSLSKYVLDLTVVSESLGQSVQELTQSLYENSFKMLRGDDISSKIFGGFSAEEIAEKVKMEGVELSDADIEQLKELFLGIEDDESEDENYGEETL